ncbi:MAG: hypothetical protein MT490_03160 [Sphingomonas sp.]|uniref:hypothetical protein n=1 Tax=Sphingomonas sp. TaxID=28214 RepID=UPI002272E12B|nr:hypothetical protein [Sphingomonas sp.]MCX8474775.1 hypothetical protein [Sphingomonas sp.]
MSKEIIFECAMPRVDEMARGERTSEVVLYSRTVAVPIISGAAPVDAFDLLRRAEA